LKDAGLTSDIDSVSFTDAKGDTQARLGQVIPEQFNDRKVDSFRTTINKVNRSVFGSLSQRNSDFKLVYTVLSPRRDSTAAVFDKTDIIKFSINSKSDKIVKLARVIYLPQEHNPDFGRDSVSQAEFTTNEGEFLVGSTKEFEIDTLLVDTSDADIFASRWAFLFSNPQTTIKVSTKLQGLSIDLNDRLQIDHPFFYNRIGSNSTAKVGALQSQKRGISDIDIEIEDLGNAFSRVATITTNTADIFDDASDNEKTLNGYITTNFGMVPDDVSPDTAGINLIW